MKVVLRGLQITVTGPTTHHVNREVAVIGGSTDEGMADPTVTVIKRSNQTAS